MPAKTEKQRKFSEKELEKYASEDDDKKKS
jgi:hypothetical protein